MAIPKEVIDLVRERAQIEEIIKRYVPSLTKKGTNYIGLCPFHKDSKPSFTVSPEKNIFHCFGCQTGGNIFTFISKVEGLSFPESVRFIGDLIGIQITENENKKNKSEYDYYLEMNSLASDLFSKSLKSDIGKNAINYLISRGLSKTDIEEFNLGYAPESWDYLKNYFSKKNIPFDKAARIGLLSESDKNGKKHYYDKFRDRVIFPIFNFNNNIIAFGGRIIGEGEPKYLNSPESEIFKKRNILYGFNIAKKYISELKRAIIVEGYLDVIACHKFGIKNVVAPLGTALTENQVNALSRICTEIILLFDPDNAGVKASIRSLEILKGKNIDIKVAKLPDLDPFDFIMKKGIREFMAVVDTGSNPIDFKIQSYILEGKDKSKIQTLINTFDVIKELKYDSERDIYLKKIARNLEIDENSVRKDFKKFLDQGENNDNIISNKFDDKSNKKTDSITKTYRELILLICNHPELIEKAVLDFSDNEVEDKISKNILKKLLNVYSTGENIASDMIFNFFPEGDEKFFLERNLIQANIIGDPNDAYTEIYLKLKLYNLEKKLKKYAGLIKDNSNSNDNIEIKEYLTEIEVLRREKEKLTSFIYNKKSSLNK